MIAIFDEGVPARLSRALAEAGCEVLRFPREWKGLKNGQLLERLASSGMECLVTCDKNFRYQQNLSARGIALVVLPRQRFRELTPFVRQIAAAIAQIERGQVVVISDRIPHRGG